MFAVRESNKNLNYSPAFESVKLSLKEVSVLQIIGETLRQKVRTIYLETRGQSSYHRSSSLNLTKKHVNWRGPMGICVNY